MFRLFTKILIISIISLLPVRVIPANADTSKKFTVVIDAGHGGKDVGACENGVMEKNINLKVAKQLENLIKKKMKDTKVVMTRDDDTYLTLQQRADKANNSHGDIFVSIHTNSISKKSKSRNSIEGSSVYTLGLHKDEDNLEVAMRENSVIELEQDYQQKYSGFDPQRDESYIIFEMAQKKNLSQSIKFAESVEKELEKSGRKNRGVHQAGFWVLWATSMPSVLVELDFICNPVSAKYMTSDKGSKELAEAIFKAIQQYEASWSKSVKTIDRNDDVSEEPIIMEGTEIKSYALVSENPSAVRKVKPHKPLKINYTGVRKRRSLASRQLSSMSDYEKQDLVYPGVTDYATIMIEESPVQEIQLADNTKQADKEKKKKRNNKKSEKKSVEKKGRTAKNNDKDLRVAKVNKLVTVYKIQIHSSSDLLNQGNSLFCGLSPISTYKENNLYKYFYGESTDKNELEAVLSDVREKIPEAFIVTSTKSVQAN